MICTLFSVVVEKLRLMFGSSSLARCKRLSLWGCLIMNPFSHILNVPLTVQHLSSLSRRRSRMIRRSSSRTARSRSPIVTVLDNRPMDSLQLAFLFKLLPLNVKSAPLLSNTLCNYSSLKLGTPGVENCSRMYVEFVFHSTYPLVTFFHSLLFWATSKRRSLFYWLVDWHETKYHSLFTLSTRESDL